MSNVDAQQALERRRLLQEGDVQISERAYNLVIGAVLAWGFLINYTTITLWGDQVVNWIYNMGVGPFIIGYFVAVLIGVKMTHAESPVISFAGYNLIVIPLGLVLCVALVGVDPYIIRTAILLTAVVTLSFMIASMIIPDFFMSLGRVLFFSLLTAIVGEIVCLIFFRGRSFIFEWIFAGIFGLYIGYDWVRANSCARTVSNAVYFAASLYVDIINLFLRLLRILRRVRR